MLTYLQWGPCGIYQRPVSQEMFETPIHETNFNIEHLSEYNELISGLI